MKLSNNLQSEVMKPADKPLGISTYEHWEIRCCRKKWSLLLVTFYALTNVEDYQKALILCEKHYAVRAVLCFSPFY